MPAAKKRKVGTAEIGKRPSSTKAITAYAKISKAYVVSKDIKDKSDRPANTKVVQCLELGRKRKSLSLDDDKSDDEANQIPVILQATISKPQRDIKHLSDRSSLKRTPATPKSLKTVLLASNSSDTPTKGARGLLDHLLISSSPLTKQKSLRSPSQHSVIQDTTSSLGESIIADQDTLPAELIDLVNLHSAFLTALTLHHAHNGTHTPADLRNLCPDVARAWGKRKVLAADIQRVLGVLNNASLRNHEAQEAQINLSNYGYGKICVEVKGDHSTGSNAARPLDEIKLNETFLANLQALWDEEKNSVGDSISKFVEQLPQESIKICSSLSKMSPMLAKGQRRLEDLKAGMKVKRQTEKENREVAAVEDEKEPKLTLLERIMAKQLRQAKLSPPPSKEELSRKQALHRMEEVVAILTLLTTSTSVGQVRVSFTLATILGKLKDSFRTPISKDEGEVCIRLLASDIAPEWLRIVKMGKFDAVLVSRNNQPSILDIQARIKHAA